MPPVLEYFVIPPAHWHVDDQQRVRSHFNEYRLADIFSTEAAADIPEIISTKKRTMRANSPEEFLSYLAEKGNNPSLPVNNWRRVMFNAVSTDVASARNRLTTFKCDPASLRRIHDAPSCDANLESGHLRLMHLIPIYQKPNTSTPSKGHQPILICWAGCEWNAPGLPLSCGRHGLVHAQGSGLADIEHAGGRLLRQCAERGHPPLRR